MILPLFKSHHSLGRSILSLAKKNTRLTNGPDSIIDLCLDHDIKHFQLVDDTIAGFLEAYSNTKDEDLSFEFGLKINVSRSRHEKNDASLKSTSKYIIFAKNEDGYRSLIKIYSDAAVAGYYYAKPHTDFNVLREFWDESNLSLAVPFYDSFIFNNTLQGGECIPEFDFTEPIFFVEENELFFDSVIRKRVESFCKDKYKIQETKSIYYKQKSDFKSYLTHRCMNHRSQGQNSTIDKPNLEHLSSNEFCFESWAEKEGVEFMPSREYKPKLRKPEQANEEQPKPDKLPRLDCETKEGKKFIKHENFVKDFLEKKYNIKIKSPKWKDAADDGIMMRDDRVVGVFETKTRVYWNRDSKTPYTLNNLKNDRDGYLITESKILNLYKQSKEKRIQSFIFLHIPHDKVIVRINISNRNGDALAKYTSQKTETYNTCNDYKGKTVRKNAFIPFDEQTFEVLEY